MLKIIMLSLISLSTIVNWAQSDSSIFNYEDYISIVKNNHPISFQAILQTKKGEAKLKKAKGGFDPKIETEMYQKYYDGKKYYSYLHSGLKIPTWFGVDINAGYGNTEGYYLNPESQTPIDGLWQAGLSINLGKGLLIDERRAELKQAKTYVNSTLMVQKLMLNQLVFDASKAYWDWYQTYHKVEIYKEALESATLRFNIIKKSALLGEKALIDTVKAGIQVQNRKLNLIQAQLDLVNKKTFLETFLWQDGFIPLILDSNLKPTSYKLTKSIRPDINLLSSMDSLIINHPEMIYYRYNIDILKIDYRLKKENLKPTIRLKYNTLSAPTDQNILGEYSLNNYNWGASVSYPIFTRKERGELELSQIEIQEKESILQNKEALINYKLISAYNNWTSSADQVNLYTKTIINYTALFDSELALFSIGEGSVFLVNYREQELIKSRIMLIELLYASQISELKFNYQTVKY
jgi:outer membrane protein TolC